MIITCIYNNQLGCRLDNKQQQLIVEFVASRDFKVEDAGKLFDHLNKWLAHVERVEKTMEESLKNVGSKIEESAKRRVKVQDKADAMHAEAIADSEAQRKSRKPMDMGNPLFGLLSGQFGGMQGPEHGHEYGQGHGHGHF